MAEERSIAVIGGGTMGVGIAYVFAAAGYPVTVVEVSAARQATLRTELRQAADAAVSRGKFDSQAADALCERITLVANVDDLADGMTLAVETVPEREDLKRRVLAQIEAKSPSLLASNTSALSIDKLAAGLARPANFLGMHFFNPVWSLQLVELIRGASTSEDTIDRARTLVAELGKHSIVVRDIPGFATSRLDMAAALEAMRMFEAGVASADDIDLAATEAYRHPVGPLRLSDIVGLDVRLDIARALEAAHGERFAPPRILIDKVAAGELGRKSGQGFHRWNDE